MCVGGGVRGGVSNVSSPRFSVVVFVTGGGDASVLSNVT